MTKVTPFLLDIAMKLQKILHQSIYAILRPLIRILLRNNISYPAFDDMVRKAYVEVAEREFTTDKKKQTNSRISTLTGLSRKEVKRLQELPEAETENNVLRYNRAARVVYGWVHDENYQESASQQKELAFDNDEYSFTQLVKTYSGDIPPRTILDELVRIGLVKHTEAGKLKLLKRAYIPEEGLNEKIQYLGKDVSTLLQTMDRNIYQKELTAFFQRKVYYDNLPDECIEELKKMIAKNSQLLLEKIDKTMAEHDRDVNPAVDGTGRNAIGIGIYYFEDEVSQEKTSD